MYFIEVIYSVTPLIIVCRLYYYKLNKYRTSDVDVVKYRTNTSITYPKHGTEGILEILGISDESVQEAKAQIVSIIADIREQLSPLQFVSIPLYSSEIKHNFEEFKKNILAENHGGVEESIFVSSLKLHLTILVFTLLNEQEIQEALNTLRECKNLFLRNVDQRKNPIKMKVQGLNCMNSNLSKVNVLYAEPYLTDDSECEKDLQEIANAISNLFYEKGFAKENRENVKLHMTLMNTKYRKPKKKDNPSRRWIKRETFDATQIMEKYKDFYFGEAMFNNIHLSLMSCEGEDGYYTSLGSVKMFE
ncbi:hypothetical protein WA026_001150 [Henosepilachna vigintioctopunctata]|uniref:A-kinase anchor protein 7-like phosphoesterase domain-containing protein n=1 Tax=Henosepilachna vigintioctopunctata TaxID=420089 RepID=A0AAW1V9M2_9CUCU